MSYQQLTIILLTFLYTLIHNHIGDTDKMVYKQKHTLASVPLLLWRGHLPGGVTPTIAGI